MPRKQTNHKRDVEQYVDGVLKGKIVACEFVKAAVKRHKRDLKTAKKRGLYFDPVAANRVINVAQLLKHTTGEFAGRRFLLEPWQKFILWSLFGWKRISDRMRRFRDAFITVARGNGKSPIAALIMVILLCADLPREFRAQLKCAATERDQARIVWEEAGELLRTNELLESQCEFLKNSIVHLPTRSRLVPLGKESHTKDGFNLHGYVVDEIHAFKEEHRELLEKLVTAMGKRRQPLGITITTAGSDRSEIWLGQYEYSRKVVAGVVDDDAHFSFIAQLDEADDPFDERTWPKANPNLGISVKIDHLRRMATRAQADPLFKLEFLRYHCNLRVRSAAKVITPALWASGNKPVGDLEGRLCHGAVDLGWRNDLASFSLVFPPSEGKRKYRLRSWSWIPEECERDLAREPFARFMRSGSLRTTPGNTTDVQAILAKVLDCRERYDLQTVALDPNNARQFGTTLVNDHGIQVYEFFQTTRKYNEPTRVLLQLLVDGLLLHGGDPLLAWAADNLVLRTDHAGYVMPDKQKSDEKIDPIVAGIMALSECLFAEKQQPSVYEKRGIREI